MSLQPGKTRVRKGVRVVGCKGRGLFEALPGLRVAARVEGRGSLLHQVLDLLLQLLLLCDGIFRDRLRRLLHHDLLLAILQRVPQLGEARLQLVLLGLERGKLALFRRLISGLLPGQHVVQGRLHLRIVKAQRVEDLQRFLVFALARVVVGLFQGVCELGAGNGSCCGSRG